jgi:hypothetical protein
VGGLVALPGGVQIASQGFELAYIGEDGREYRAPLALMARTAFELVPLALVPVVSGSAQQHGAVVVGHDR